MNKSLGIQIINQYLQEPEVSKKIASRFPRATGTPVQLETLEDCIEKIASQAYLHRKTRMLISSGITSIREI